MTKLSRRHTGWALSRAICAYGTERGLREFVRYGFLVRRGRCKSAVPLGRFLARRHAQADLLSEVERWLGDLRAAAGPTARQAPASVARALRQLESSIFDLCQAEEAAPRLQGVLLALGQAERALARSLAWAAPKDGGVKCPPLCGLSRRWLRDTYDHSAEYRLAAALASTVSLKRRGDQDIWVGFRAHLEPVALTDRGVLAWDKACRDTVWHEGDFADVLNRVFQRRLIWAQQLNLRERPDRGLPAPLSDVAAFIYGETDDARLARLTWALALLDWGKKPALTWNLPWAVEYKRPAAPPAVFSLMRLALASSDELKRADLPPVPLTPSIHYHAMTGNGLEASRLACRRLRASRLAPALSETAVSDVLARRAAAALAFPLRPLPKAGCGCRAP
jgi:CRISPR-associated protein Csx17